MSVRTQLGSIAPFMLLTLLTALTLVACAGPSGAPSDPPASASPFVVEPAPAADPDTLLRDAAANDGRQVQVPGFFLATDGTAQLCSMVLESYPPQCGGGAVRLTGQVPADVLARLDKTSEPGLAQATWGSVIVTGTFRASGVDGLPTIELSDIVVQAS